MGHRLLHGEQVRAGSHDQADPAAREDRVPRKERRSFLGIDEKANRACAVARCWDHRQVQIPTPQPLVSPKDHVHLAGTEPVVLGIVTVPPGDREPEGFLIGVLQSLSLQLRQVDSRPKSLGQGRRAPGVVGVGVCQEDVPDLRGLVSQRPHVLQDPVLARTGTRVYQSQLFASREEIDVGVQGVRNAKPGSATANDRDALRQAYSPHPDSSTSGSRTVSSSWDERTIASARWTATAPFSGGTSVDCFPARTQSRKWDSSSRRAPETRPCTSGQSPVSGVRTPKSSHKDSPSAVRFTLPTCEVPTTSSCASIVPHRSSGPAGGPARVMGAASGTSQVLWSTASAPSSAVRVATSVFGTPSPSPVEPVCA